MPKQPWEEPPFWEVDRGGGPVTDWMRSRERDRGRWRFGSDAEELDYSEHRYAYRAHGWLGDGNKWTPKRST